MPIALSAFHPVNHRCFKLATLVSHWTALLTPAASLRAGALMRRRRCGLCADVLDWSVISCGFVDEIVGVQGVLEPVGGGTEPE